MQDPRPSRVVPASSSVVCGDGYPGEAPLCAFLLVGLCILRPPSLASCLHSVNRSLEGVVFLCRLPCHAAPVPLTSLYFSLIPAGRKRRVLCKPLKTRGFSSPKSLCVEKKPSPPIVRRCISTRSRTCPQVSTKSVLLECAGAPEHHISPATAGLGSPVTHCVLAVLVREPCLWNHVVRSDCSKESLFAFFGEETAVLLGSVRTLG